MTWVARVEPWSLRLHVGGEDLSAQLTGDIRTDTERGAARTLDVQLHFTGAIEPDRYTGRDVTLDVLYAGAAWRRFTGYVDEPRVEPLDSLLVLICSDQRNAQLNALARTDIDTLVGATPHAAFVDDEDTGSEYAEVAVAHSLVSLGVGADGVMVAHDIVTAPTPRLTLDIDDAFDASVQVVYAQADRLVNARVLTVRAQRNRYWRRQVSLSWDWGRSFADYLARGHTLPNEGMWKQAVDGLGWFTHSLHYDNLPGSGTYYLDTGLPVPAEVAAGATGVTAFLSQFPELITGARALVEAWWTQQVTMAAQMTFEVATSIARHGRREATATVSYRAPQETAWESAKSPASRPDVTFTGGLAGGYRYGDDVDAARDGAWLQACADTELRALYDVHCQTRLRLAIPWHADDGGPLEVGDTVAVNFDTMTATGIVIRAQERFDIGNPDAEHLIELALCRGGSPAVTRPTATFAAPATDALAPAGAIDANAAGAVTGAEIAAAGTQLGNDSGAQAAYDPDLNSYSGNFGNQYSTTGEVLGDMFPVEIFIESPEVPADHRDARNVAVPVAVVVELPHDPLEVVL